MNPLSVETTHVQSLNPDTAEQVENVLTKLDKAFHHLKEHFVGRDTILEQILYALLTREHSLIIGDRGLAKSRLARSVFAQFSDNCSPFSLQLTRSTSVGQLVGGLDLAQFERGTYVHNLEGYIVRAHFAFLDELFDANDFVLRALNGILNEREFLNGPQIEKAALHSAIATTNYVRDTRESRAVLDRLLFKGIVRRAETTLHRFRIRREFISSHGGTVHALPGNAIHYKELQLLAKLITGELPGYRIHVPPHVLVMLDEIISNFESRMNQDGGAERFSFSDRTKNKAIHVLIASALRARRTAVETRDLAALHYLIATVGAPEEEEIFDHCLSLALKQYLPKDREAVDRAAAISDAVEELVHLKRTGELESPAWQEKMKARLGHWLHLGGQQLTLKGLMEEVRSMTSENKIISKMRDEVMLQIREAHEVHHIPFEQPIGS